MGILNHGGTNLGTGVILEDHMEGFIMFFVTSCRSHVFSFL